MAETSPSTDPTLSTAEHSERPQATSSSSSAPVRARVWRACEVCRKRKVKCNGQEPCSYCLSSGKICSFKEITDNASIARQQANTVDSRLSRVEDSVQRFLPVVAAFEEWMKSNGQTVPSGFPFKEPPLDRKPLSSQLLPPPPPPPPPPPARVAYSPSPAIQYLSIWTDSTRRSPSVLSPGAYDGDHSDGPERWSDRFAHLTKDSYGNLRYTGGTSSFLLMDALTSLKTKTPDASPESNEPATTADITLPFFTPGKRFRAQLALPRAEDLEYPTAEVADELVAIYFSRVHHTFPILQQQLFVERYTKAMEAYYSGKPSTDSPFLACMFAVFACGACASGRAAPVSRKKDGSDTPTDFHGMEYYEKAQLLCWIASGASQIEHVQSLSLMAICNASWNTLAQSYINAGQAIRRAHDIGLHRITRRSPLTPFEKEVRRRVWWCVYGLDKVLSIALGRPSGAHDDDCNVEMPAELDDAQMFAHFSGEAVTPGTTYMAAFVPLLRVYVIAGKVARFVQSALIDDPRTEQIRRQVRELDSELNQWLANLPQHVKITAEGKKDPQMYSLCLIMYFVYFSSVINLHRPFIPDDPSEQADLSSLGRCVFAARSCIWIGGMTRDLLPTSHHLAYAVQYITLSAVLLLRCVIYVNRKELVSTILKDSEKCIEILKRMQKMWSASKRCAEIVSDLLVVVKTKLYGGSAAIQDLQTAQQIRVRATLQPTPNGFVAPDPKGKRKRSPHDMLANGPASRPRIDGYNGNGWGIPPEATPHPPPQDEPVDINGSRYSERVSNLRTAVEGGREGPMSPHQLTHPSAINGNMGGGVPQFSDFTPPQISLDLNTITPEVDGLPFSDYNFIGNELFAVLGNVIRPPTEPSAKTFEENSQFLWQAFHRAPFSEHDSS